MLNTLPTQNQINLPDGFTMRPAALADIDAVTALANASAQKYINNNDFGKEELLSFWQMPGFDMTQSTRIVSTPNGRIAAYIDIDDVSSVPVKPFIWGRVHPDYEHLGIGTALLNWVEERASLVLPRVPADVRVVVHAGVWRTAEPALKLMAQNGYKHIRDFWRMEITFNGQPSAPIWPDGITLSNFAERPDIQALIAAKDEAFKDHWGYVARPLDEMVKDWMHWVETDPHIEPAGWLLAMAGEEIAGVCLCRLEEYTDPEKGWVSVLAVRRPYRHQGLGLALLQQSFCMFYERGKKRAGLSVDASSLTGATRLYDKAGMVVERQDLAFEKEIRPGRDISIQTTQAA